MKEFNNVLVTGANGFIGSNLKKYLARKQPQISITPLYGPSHQSEVSGDITDFSMFATLPEKCDVIVHLAALTDYATINKRPTYAFSNYIIGLNNIITYALKAGVKKIVFLSSIKAYGDAPMPFDENIPPMPTVLMGKLKVESERILSLLNATSGIDIVVLRVSNAYGFGQSSRFLIPKMIEAIIYNKEIALCDLSTMRNYIYIDDLIEAIHFFTFSEFPGYSVFNIANSSSTRIKELVETIESYIGTKLVYNEGMLRTDEKPTELISIDKAALAGWIPSTSISEGIRQTVAKYLEILKKDGKYEV